MSKASRILHAVETQHVPRLDDAVQTFVSGLAVMLPVAATATFIASCLAAGAPLVETVVSGLLVGAATFLGILIRFRIAGERLFRERGTGRPESEREGGEVSESAPLPSDAGRALPENAAPYGIRRHVARGRR